MENKTFTNLDELSTEKVFNLIQYQDSFKDLYPGYAPEYENEYEEDYYFKSKEDAYNKVNDLLEFFNSFPNSVPIYRTIKVKSINDIDYDYIGDSWSYSKESAINFAKNQNGGNVLLSGKISFFNIDWKNTIRNHFLFSEDEFGNEAENEIKVNNFDEIESLKAEYIKNGLREIRMLIREIVENTFENKHLIPVTKLNHFVYHKSNPIFRNKIARKGLIPKEKSDAWLVNTNIKGKVIFATNSDNKKHDHYIGIS